MYRFRGDAYAAKGDRDGAIEDYTQVIRINPRDAAAYCSRGEAYRGGGELDKAIADFSTALAATEPRRHVLLPRPHVCGER